MEPTSQFRASEGINVLVAGLRNAEKLKVIKSITNTPKEKFEKNIPFQELKNDKIPITFIEANNESIEELQQELEIRFRISTIHLCWFVLSGSMTELTEKDSEAVTCLSEYFEKIIFVFTDVDNMISSKYHKILLDIVEDPMIVLLPSKTNSSSIISYDSSLNQLINVSFTIIPSDVSLIWQMLIDFRQKRIFHGIDNKPETIDFNGIEIIVQDTDIGHLNIILAGKSGAGKSTLINTVLGKDVSKEGVGNSVTNEIQEFEVNDLPITVIDSPGFELGDNQRNFTSISSLINERKRLNNVSKHIHIMWYCINEQECRIQDIDNKVIKEISKSIPVFIVLTNAIKTKNSDADDPNVSLFAALKRSFPGAASYHDYFELTKKGAKRINFINLSKSNIAIHRLVAKPITLGHGFIQPAYGLSEFIELHKYYLTQISQYVLNATQEIEYEARKDAAKNYITQCAQAAMQSINKPIRASEVYKYKPLIQSMLIEVSRVLNIPIHGGSILILSENLLSENEDSYGTFKDIVGFLMGFAEKSLVETGNPFLILISEGINFIHNLLFHDNDVPILSEIMGLIGNNFIDTVSILRNNKMEMNSDNFMQVYTSSIKMKKKTIK